jgi:hypothetical protein
VHHHDESERLDARTAVEAHTVGGWRAAEVTARAAGSDGSARRNRRLGGEVAVGAPAYLAVWQTTPAADPQPGRDGSDDAEVRDLDALVAPGRELPRCDLTIVAGRAAHDALDEWPGGETR